MHLCVGQRLGGASILLLKGRERAGGSVFRGQLGRSAEGRSGGGGERSVPQSGKGSDIRVV